MAARPSRPTESAARCPVCDKAAAPKSSFVPFCSQRCKMVDLGRWLTGDYVIAGEDAIQLDPEELEGYLQKLEADKRAADARAQDDEGDEPDDHA